MSRYDNLSPLAISVMALIQPSSSLRPISQADILAQARTIAPPDEIHDAVEHLLDAHLISSMRHTRDGVTQNVYWPTGLKPIAAPSLEEISMSAQTQSAKLLRAIVQHGPIIGSELAMKVGVPAKSIDSILDAPNTRSTVVTRLGFVAEKGKALKHYMTLTQAEEWDAREAAAETEESAGHVMSAPGKTKQSVAENPVNESDDETATESAELAEARLTIQSLHDSIDGMLSDWTDIRQALEVSTHEEAMQAISLLKYTAGNYSQIKEDHTTNLALIHDLKNDVAGANLVLSQLARKLNVEKFEDVPGAFDELTQSLCTRAMQPKPVSGRLALITYSDNDADLQYLEPYVSEADASRVALNQVNTGTNERCTLIRVLGEAQRPRATWKQLEATGIATLSGEHQEAA